MMAIAETGVSCAPMPCACFLVDIITLLRCQWPITLNTLRTPVKTPGFPGVSFLWLNRAGGVLLAGLMIIIGIYIKNMPGYKKVLDPGKRKEGCKQKFQKNQNLAQNEVFSWFARFSPKNGAPGCAFP